VLQSLYSVCRVPESRARRYVLLAFNAMVSRPLAVRAYTLSRKTSPVSYPSQDQESLTADSKLTCRDSTQGL
jgi:hypothetical protein